MQGAPRYNDSSLSALEPPALRAQELHLAHPRGRAVQDSKIRPGANINSETGSHALLIRSANRRAAALGPVPRGQGGVKRVNL